MTFTPHVWQLAAVDAYHSRLGGVFIGLDPGAGKTYAFARIAERCARALVLVPSQGVMRQTMAQFRSYGVACRRVQDPDHGERVVFATYAWLQRAAQADFLDRFAPSDILMDEFHEARGLGNSARKRLERYLIDQPRVRVAISTASPMSRSVREMTFGLRWALRAAVSWLPSTDSGLERLEYRLNEHDGVARAEFRARLEATPGVFLDVGDVGRYQGRVELRVIRRDPALTLPPTWELPNGFLASSPAHAADLERQLAWGFYPEYTPPSEAYVEARRAWAAVVRRHVVTGQADTPYQVRALAPDAYAAWAEAEAAEGPLVEASATWAATPWMPPSPTRIFGPSLVWARHRALQARVGAELYVPVFGPGARAAGGAYLPDYRGQCAVASADACYQSLNLQHFGHSLVLEPSADPEWWRQMVGRTARQGQKRAVVTVDVVVNCGAAERALRTALDAAEKVRQITGKSSPLLQLNEKEW